MRNNTVTQVILLTLVFALLGCGRTTQLEEEPQDVELPTISVNDNSGNNLSPLIPSVGSTLDFRMIRYLQPLYGQHYEGWLIVGGQPISTGRFNVNYSGTVYDVDVFGQGLRINGHNGEASFTVTENVSSATAYVLTIEPNFDGDPGPSSTHILAGDLSGGIAIAHIGHPAAIGTTFQNASGSFILATPSNGPDTANQGIWWLNLTDSGPVPTLTLPVLPDGWKYEGWVVNPYTGGFRSTGTFLSPTGADSDGAGPTAGPNPFPPFPGQDFIFPPIVLNSGFIHGVITVEPYPDPDPYPFKLKILNAPIAANAPVMTDIPMSRNSSDTFPLAIAILR